MGLASSFIAANLAVDNASFRQRMLSDLVVLLIRSRDSLVLEHREETSQEIGLNLLKWLTEMTLTKGARNRNIFSQQMGLWALFQTFFGPGLMLLNCHLPRKLRTVRNLELVKSLDAVMEIAFSNCFPGANYQRLTTCLQVRMGGNHFYLWRSSQVYKNVAECW